MDPEDPEAKGFEFTEQSIRKAFIRKVFSILTVSNERVSVNRMIKIIVISEFRRRLKFLTRFNVAIFSGATSDNSRNYLPFCVPHANAALGHCESLAFDCFFRRSFRHVDRFSMLRRIEKKIADELYSVVRVHAGAIFPAWSCVCEL